MLEGEVAFVCGGQWIGERPVRVLVMCTPAGFERFVLDQATSIAEPAFPPDMERLMVLAERRGIEIHGPLPEAPADFGR